MEKDCGMWIHILSHKLKKRMNANMQILGLTGGQSRIMHYILVKSDEGPVFQRDVEKAFGMSRFDCHRHFAADGEERLDCAGKRCQRCAPEKPDPYGTGGTSGRADRRPAPQKVNSALQTA